MSEDPARVVPLPGSPWSEAECCILRERYVSSGLRGVRALLPGRDSNAIGNKARKIGLIRQPHGPVVASTPEIDEAIRAIYRKRGARMFRRGELEAFAAKWKRRSDWVRSRASVLGVRAMQKKADWSRAEEEIIEENAGRTTTTIRDVLKRAGYQRSVNAINCRIYHCGFERIAVFHFSASELAELMGVTQKTVGHWIEGGLLKARRASTAERGPWEITAKDVRAFMIENISRWSPGRIDAWWLVDILTGRGEDGK